MLLQALRLAPPLAGRLQAFFAFSPEAEYDSWITVGISDGGSPGALGASPGFDLSAWSLEQPLGPYDNAAIFWMNPADGPIGPDPVVMGQLTVPSGSAPTATALLQGKPSVGDDWRAFVTWEPAQRPPPPPPPPPLPPTPTPGPPWQGDGECDIPDINECISNPCDNGAACLDSHNDSSIPHHQYRCACQSGFANGTCTFPPGLDTVVLYWGLCDQPDGNCDFDVDECMSRPCDAGYTCIDLSEDPVEPESDAFDCEPVSMDPCISEPCLNGATCAAASLSSVGRRQWLLQCTEGVPTIEFAAPGDHNELSVFDGGSVHAPRLMSCGGHCDQADGTGCQEPCTTAQGTGSQVTLAYSSRGGAGGELQASYRCVRPPGVGRRLDENVAGDNDNISPSVCGTSYVVVAIQDPGSPYSGMQTLQLSIELSSVQGNLYTVFGTPSGPMDLPPAFQAGPSDFGVDIGGVNPSYFSVSLAAELDSWLTIGSTDGSLGDQLNSAGIDFDAWTEDSGLLVSDGAVFLMDPFSGPSGSVVVAQITVPTATVPSIVMGAQGHLAGQDMNWQCSGATWMFTDVVTLTDGGVADLTTTNSSVPHDAYICTCAPGFANGQCAYDFIEE